MNISERVNYPTDKTESQAMTQWEYIEYNCEKTMHLENVYLLYASRIVERLKRLK